MSSPDQSHTPDADKAAPMAEPEGEDTEYDRTESLNQNETSMDGCDVMDDDEKVVINVGGSRHEILLSTLASKPGTRLSYLTKRHKKRRAEEYFFDRHPGVFNTVMDYYRSGELHVPLSVCGAVVKRELDYWQIDDCMVEPCCWISYSSYIDNQKTLSDFNQSVAQENEELAAMRGMSGWKKKQMDIWMILDHPRSSKLALVYAVTSFMFVLGSIAGFCLETLPSMHLSVAANASRQCGDGGSEGSLPDTHEFLQILDYICTAFFTLELIVRVIFAPNKIAFIRSPMNVIDILALLPLYVQIILEMTDTHNCLRNHTAVIETIFVLRIVRIFRIFHLVKHYKALKILVHAIKASIQELLMLSIFLFIAMLVFSTLIFYAERPGPLSTAADPEYVGSFGTIPIGFYWSIVTMTTVGYGDLYPKTPLGFCIGALCALCGVLLVALTIPVISNNFALFYMHARTRDKITFKDKETEEHEKVLYDARVKNKMGSNGARCRGLDSKALLMSVDSNSTTDESGIMLTAKALEEGCGGPTGSGSSAAKQTKNFQNETLTETPM